MNWIDLARNCSKKIEASVVEMSRFENWIGDREGSNKTRNEVASTEMVSSESKSSGNVTVMWYDREAPILPTEEDAGVCWGRGGSLQSVGARRTEPDAPSTRFRSVRVPGRVRVYFRHTSLRCWCAPRPQRGPRLRPSAWSHGRRRKRAGGGESTRLHLPDRDRGGGRG